MDELLAAFARVWTPPYLVGAVVSGLVIGLGLSWPIANPLWSSRTASRVQVSTLVAVMVGWIVTVLYVAAVVVSLPADQPGLLSALAARYTLFLFAALVSGIGCWVGLRIRGTW